MPQRIALNMWPFTTTRAGGSFYYAASLLREFSQICPDEIVVLFSPQGRKLLEKTEGFNRVKSLEINTIREIFDHCFDFDVLFTPGAWRWFNVSDVPCVNFIPDIQEYYYPEFFSRLELLDRQYYRPYAAHSSTILITISEYSKKTILDKLRVSEDKVRVIYPACEPIFRDDADKGRRPDSLLGIETPYLFYPANSWKHKNHRRLLEALAILKHRHGVTVPCLFSGHLLHGEFNNVDVPGEINKLGLESQVKHIGRVSLPELKYLYTHAMALIVPSLFEGFGIPLVEAMACRCPVIAAHRTSIPEIADEAALYFDPDDPADIAEKILHFIQNPGEAQQRVEKGLILSQGFSYRRQAEEHLAVLEEAYCIDSPQNWKRKALRKHEELNRPALAVIFAVKSYDLSRIVNQLVKLDTEFKNIIEMVIITDNATTADRLIRNQTDIRIIVTENDFHSSIVDALKAVSSPFVLLSDGNTIPLSHFIHQITATGDDFEEDVELFHGDSYYTDKRHKHHWTDLVPSGTENDERKSYCLKNLSFVVRRESLVRLMRCSQYPLKSLGEVTRALWDTCPKQRIYQATSVRRVCSPIRIDISASVLISRIAKNYGEAHPVLRLAWIPGTETLFLVALTVYNVLPAAFQLMVQRFYKTLAGKLKRFSN